MFAIGDEVVDKQGNEYVVLESLSNLAAYNVISNGKIITMSESALMKHPGEDAVKAMQRIQFIIDNTESRLREMQRIRDNLFKDMRT